MYSFDDRNTLITIPEQESQQVSHTKMDSLESPRRDARLRVRGDVETLSGGMQLNRRLRRMKRKLFLEAVGEDYIASMSASSRAPLRTLSSASSSDSADDFGN